MLILQSILLVLCRIDIYEAYQIPVVGVDVSNPTSDTTWEIYSSEQPANALDPNTLFEENILTENVDGPSQNEGNPSPDATSGNFQEFSNTGSTQPEPEDISNQFDISPANQPGDIWQTAAQFATLPSVTPASDVHLDNASNNLTNTTEQHQQMDIGNLTINIPYGGILILSANLSVNSPYKFIFPFQNFSSKWKNLANDGINSVFSYSGLPNALQKLFLNRNITEMNNTGKIASDIIMVQEQPTTQTEVLDTTLQSRSGGKKLFVWPPLYTKWFAKAFPRLAWTVPPYERIRPFLFRPRFVYRGVANVFCLFSPLICN